MPDHVLITIPSDIRYLESILDIAEVFLKNNIKDERIIGDLVASVSEATSNAVIHGNSSPDSSVYVSIMHHPRYIEISIEDSNPVFFNFLETTKEPDILSVSGRGLFIVRAYVDELLLIRGEHGNKLILRKQV